MEMYKIGILVGLLVAIAVGVVIGLVGVLANHSDGKIREKYDERQEVARGKGFKYGFWTLAGFETALAVLSVAHIEVPVNTACLQFTLVMASVLVTSIYCIWKGAFFGINTNKKGNMTFLFVLGLINLGLGVLHVFTGEMFADGDLHFPFINFVCGVCLLVIVTEAFIKKTLDAKAAKKEECDE